MSRVGVRSGQEVFKYDESSRVWSRGFRMLRVGSGRVGSGRVGSGRVGCFRNSGIVSGQPDPTREV